MAKSDALSEVKMKVSEVKQLITHVIKHNSTAKPEDQFVVMIKSGPGIGKTAILRQIANESESLQGRLYISHPATDDPTDAKGLPWPSAEKDSATFLPTGVIADILKEDKPAIWLADDFGQAPQAVQVAYMQWLHGKELNGKKLGQNINIVLATNRVEDKAGVFPVPEPVKGRMIIVELEFNLDEWVKWAIESGMPYEIFAFARFRPDIFDTYKPTTALVNQVTPRTLARAGTLINSKLPENLWLPTFAGTIGQSAAVELVAFLQIVSKLPDPDSILLNPDVARIPDGVDAKHAIVGALVKRSTPATVEAAFKYIGRFGDKAYDFMFAKDIQVKEELVKTTAFTKFSTDNHHILQGN